MSGKSLFEIKFEIQEFFIDSLGTKSEKYIDLIDDIDTIEQLEQFLKSARRTFMNSENNNMVFFISQIIKDLNK